MREIGNVTILCRSIHLASSSIEWAGKPENRFLSKISNSAADPPLTGSTTHWIRPHCSSTQSRASSPSSQLGFRVWHIMACHIYVWAVIYCPVFFSGLCCKLWFILRAFAMLGIWDKTLCTLISKCFSFYLAGCFDLY